MARIRTTGRDIGGNIAELSAAFKDRANFRKHREFSSFSPLSQRVSFRAFSGISPVAAFRSVSPLPSRSPFVPYNEMDLVSNLLREQQYGILYLSIYRQRLYYTWRRCSGTLGDSTQETYLGAL